MNDIILLTFIVSVIFLGLPILAAIGEVIVRVFKLY